jgi:hypothetical protein
MGDAMVTTDCRDLQLEIKGEHEERSDSWLVASEEKREQRDQEEQ